MIDRSLIKLIQPVVGGIISQGFGENPQAYARFGQAGHNGIDYAVPEGTPVMAAADGVVSRAGSDKTGYGNMIMLDHGGYFTLYGHLSQILVKNLRVVNQGEIIGYSGNTGNSTGAHLHFELRIPDMKSTDTLKSTGYPQGAVDPSPFFVALAIDPLAQSIQDAINTSVDTGFAQDLAGIDQVRVCVPAGANLRLTPDGKIAAAVPIGTILEFCDVIGEWYGVMLWVHNSVVEQI